MFPYKLYIEVFDTIWSEKRVEHILQSDWEELKQEAFRLSVDIKNVFEDLQKLESKRQRQKYVQKLPKNLVNCLLVETARNMNDLAKYKNNSKVNIH